MTKRPNIQLSNAVDGAVKDYAEERDMNKSEGYEELLEFALDFRPPTEDEREALINYHVDKLGYETGEATHLLSTQAEIAVLSDFISGSPGYVGPLFFVVYGYPETYTLLSYADMEEGTLKEVQQEG